MVKFEKQLGAIMRCLTAETEEDREHAREDLKQLMTEAPKHAAKNVDSVIRDILLELGTPEHLKGHPYLITAIAAVTNNQDIMQAVTSELYPEVARIHNTTYTRVERAIRHAIEVTWDRADLDIVTKYFGNTVSPLKGRPTNSEFIARLANLVRQRMEEVA